MLRIFSIHCMYCFCSSLDKYCCFFTGHGRSDAWPGYKKDSARLASPMSVHCNPCSCGFCRSAGRNTLSSLGGIFGGPLLDCLCLPMSKHPFESSSRTWSTMNGKLGLLVPRRDAGPNRGLRSCFCFDLHDRQDTHIPFLTFWKLRISLSFVTI